MDDVLERNERLNQMASKMESTYTRRKVVDSLLSVLIVLAIVTLILFLLASYRLENQIKDSDTRLTQLICLHLPGGHAQQYAVCRQVGLPRR